MSKDVLYLPLLSSREENCEGCCQDFVRRVVGACRSPDAAKDLQDLASQHSQQLTLVPLDVTDEASIQVTGLQLAPSGGQIVGCLIPPPCRLQQSRSQTNLSMSTCSSMWPAFCMCLESFLQV